MLTSLSAIYKGHVSILRYSQRHADQLSRMHLRYLLTWEMIPWIDKLITYLSNPLHNEDPEPYSKRYSAGGTELVHHNLEQNLTTRKKTQHNRHKAHTMNPPPSTTHNSASLADQTSITLKTNNDTPKINMQTALHAHTNNEDTTKYTT